MKWLYKFNNWIGFPFLPIATVYNNQKTEKYTLRKDGWIIVSGVDKPDKTTDAIPITMVSEELVKKFQDALS